MLVFLYVSAIPVRPTVAAEHSFATAADEMLAVIRALEVRLFPTSRVWVLKGVYTAGDLPAEDVSGHFLSESEVISAANSMISAVSHPHP